jgi:hypothetical protein
MKEERSLAPARGLGAAVAGLAPWLAPLGAAFLVYLAGRSMAADAPNGATFHRATYRVVAPAPVVVRSEPNWDAAIIGTLNPGSLLSVSDSIQDADFWHVGGAGWDGWIIATQLSPAPWAAADEVRLGASPDVAEVRLCRDQRALCAS